MRHKHCLLIVDDDEDLLDPLNEVCGRFGFAVITASNGSRALELIEENDIDAVLTDIRMHPMGGFALIDAVRALYPEMPFIMWTGFWDRPDERKAAAYKNLERLEKPFTFKELEATLNLVRTKIEAAKSDDGDADDDNHVIVGGSVGSNPFGR